MLGLVYLLVINISTTNDNEFTNKNTCLFRGHHGVAPARHQPLVHGLHKEVAGDVRGRAEEDPDNITNINIIII